MRKFQRKCTWGGVLMYMAALFAIGCSNAAPPAEAPADREGIFSEADSRPAGRAAPPVDVVVENRGDTRLTPAEGEGAHMSPPVTSKAVEPEMNSTKKLTDGELRELGITVLESPRFRLLVDDLAPGEQGEWQQLPGLMEQFFDFLAEQQGGIAFGLPSAERGEVITGHVMRDAGLFRQAGMLPEEFADLTHGLSRGQQFWIHDQLTPYYRRHLLLHEALHGVMQQTGGDWPVWYLEGMAEMLACHQFGPTGRPEFSIMPGREQVAGGFGRIGLLRQEVDAGRFRTLSEIQQFTRDNFYPHKTSYAWSWASCSFLARHPLTLARFAELLRCRTRGQFSRELSQLLLTDPRQLAVDWGAFITELTPAADVPRMWCTLSGPAALSTLKAEESRTCEVTAERNWQTSGLRVPAQTRLQISGTGRYVVKTGPVEWESEPQGVTIDYVNGRPLGELQLLPLPVNGTERDWSTAVEQAVSIGTTREWTTPFECELLFRVNETPSGWSDNRGGLQVTVQRN